MFNKHAEYEKRRRTYLACRGVLRIKQAETADEAIRREEMMRYGDRLGDRYYGDASYDELNNRAILAGGMHGDRAARNARRAGNAARKGFEAIGSDIGAGIERSGDTISDFGGRIGDYAGRAARAAGEGMRRGVNEAGAYLSQAGKGIAHGISDAGKGLYNGTKSVGNSILNSLGRWGSDIAHNPGAHALGLGTGLGVGYLGNMAGNNIADAIGLSSDSGWRKALKWGLAGLGGLGGYWAGTGFGKGFGKGFSADRGNKAPSGGETKLLTDARTDAEKADYARRTLKEEQAADAAKSGRSGSYGSLKYKKPVQRRVIPGGEEFRNIGPVTPRKPGR